MKNAAKEHAAEDKQKRELADAKNQADTLIFSAKKQIEELKDKITPEQQAKVEEQIKNLEEALKTNNADTIKAAIENFNKAFHSIAQDLYSQQAPPQGGPTPPPDMGQEPKSKGKDDKEVQDASYEVVDDK